MPTHRPPADPTKQQQQQQRSTLPEPTATTRRQAMERLLEVFSGCLDVDDGRRSTDTTAALTKMQLDHDGDEPPPPPAFDIGLNYDGPQSYTHTMPQAFHIRPLISLRRRTRPVQSTTGMITCTSDDLTGTCGERIVGCKEAAYEVLAAAATNNYNTGGHKHYAVLGVAVPPCGCPPAHADVKARHEALCALLGTDRTSSLAVADALQLVNHAFAAITDMDMPIPAERD